MKIKPFALPSHVLGLPWPRVRVRATGSCAGHGFVRRAQIARRLAGDFEHLRGCTVSEGTFVLEDLLERFTCAIQQEAPWLWRPEWDQVETPEDRFWAVEEMAEALDEIAPSGSYFGCHPDSGSDFGWWDED